MILQILTDYNLQLYEFNKLSTTVKQIFTDVVIFIFIITFLNF